MNEMANVLKAFKDDLPNILTNRIPKKVTNLTSKEQLKVMINDLENEIGELLVALKNEDAVRRKLENELMQIKSYSGNGDFENLYNELAKMKQNLKTMENELKEERSNTQKEKSKYDRANTMLLKTEANLNKITEENKQLKVQKERIEGDYKKLAEEKNKLEEAAVRLKNEIGLAITTQDSLKVQVAKLEHLKLELTDRDQQIVSLKKELEDTKMSLTDVSFSILYKYISISIGYRFCHPTISIAPLQMHI